MISNLVHPDMMAMLVNFYNSRVTFKKKAYTVDAYEQKIESYVSITDDDDIVIPGLVDQPCYHEGRNVSKDTGTVKTIPVRLSENSEIVMMGGYYSTIQKNWMAEINGNMFQITDIQSDDTNTTTYLAVERWQKLSNAPNSG